MRLRLGVGEYNTLQREISLRSYYGDFRLPVISVLLVTTQFQREADMIAKLKSIPQLYNEATKLHYQFYHYCKNHDYKPSKQDFADLAIIEKTIKDIERLTLVLQELWNKNG